MAPNERVVLMLPNLQLGGIDEPPTLITLISSGILRELVKGHVEYTRLAYSQSARRQTHFIRTKWTSSLNKPVSQEPAAV